MQYVVNIQRIVSNNGELMYQNDNFVLWEVYPKLYRDSLGVAPQIMHFAVKFVSDKTFATRKHC